MACLGLTWELGAASGYAAVMRQIVATATSHGHRCIAIVRDLHACAPLLGDVQGLTMLQAPVATTSRTPPVRIQTSYATLLHNCGFADADTLVSRLKAWQALYRSFDIDRVLARHSPTAVLAARALGLPVTHYGTGFSIPPSCSPWPTFHPDLQPDDSRLASNERRVLATTNTALQDIGARPLSNLAEMFHDLPTALLSYPEMDPYPRSEPPPFLGLPTTNYGAPPEWPGSPRRPRLFVSLMPDDSAREWVDVIAKLPAAALLRFSGRVVRVPDLASHLSLADGAVDFAQSIAECDAVIGYGSHNLACEALLAGKPTALITKNPDHLLTARRVEALGAGIALPGRPANDSLERLHRFLADTAHAHCAQAFARSYANQARTQIADTLLQMALMAAPSG